MYVCSRKLVSVSVTGQEGKVMLLVVFSPRGRPCIRTCSIALIAVATFYATPRGWTGSSVVVSAITDRSVEPSNSSRKWLHHCQLYKIVSG